MPILYNSFPENRTFWNPLYSHIEAQIVNFRQWSSIPAVQFCPDLRVLMVGQNVFLNILFLTMYCNSKLQLWEFFGQFLEYKCTLSAKINYISGLQYVYSSFKSATENWGLRINEKDLILTESFKSSESELPSGFDIWQD